MSTGGKVNGDRFDTHTRVLHIFKVSNESEYELLKEMRTKMINFIELKKKVFEAYVATTQNEELSSSFRDKNKIFVSNDDKDFERLHHEFNCPKSLELDIFPNFSTKWKDDIPLKILNNRCYIINNEIFENKIKKEKEGEENKQILYGKFFVHRIKNGTLSIRMNIYGGEKEKVSKVEKDSIATTNGNELKRETTKDNSTDAISTNMKKSEGKTKKNNSTMTPTQSNKNKTSPKTVSSKTEEGNKGSIFQMFNKWF